MSKAKLPHRTLADQIKAELKGKGEVIQGELVVNLPDSIVEEVVLKPNKVKLKQLKGIHESIGNLIEASQIALGETVIEHEDESVKSGRLVADVGGNAMNTLFLTDPKKKDVSVVTTYTTHGDGNLDEIRTHLSGLAQDLFK